MYRIRLNFTLQKLTSGGGVAPGIRKEGSKWKEKKKSVEKLLDENFLKGKNTFGIRVMVGGGERANNKVQR
jgi:hypothetical protein